MARTARCFDRGTENAELLTCAGAFGCAALTVPVFVIEWRSSPGEPLKRLASANVWSWIQLLLATPVVLWGGWPFFARAWQSVVNRSLNMFTLIGLGVAVGYLYSLTATIFPAVFPHSFRGHGNSVPVYFEAAAVITTLVLLGQVLELKARSQTGAAIKALLGLAPKTARLLRAAGSEEDGAFYQVHFGDAARATLGRSCGRGVVLRLERN